MAFQPTQRERRMDVLLNRRNNKRPWGRRGYPATGPLAIRLRVPQQPAAVRWEPEGQQAEWSWRDGILTATIRSVQIHGAVIIE